LSVIFDWYHISIYSPIQGGVDAKELFHLYIMIWIQDKRLSLLESCKLDKVCILKFPCGFLQIFFFLYIFPCSLFFSAYVVSLKLTSLIITKPVIQAGKMVWSQDTAFNNSIR